MIHEHTKNYKDLTGWREGRWESPRRDNPACVGDSSHNIWAAQSLPHFARAATTNCTFSVLNNQKETFNIVISAWYMEEDHATNFWFTSFITSRVLLQHPPIRNLPSNSGFLPKPGISITPRVQRTDWKKTWVHPQEFRNQKKNH